MDKKKKFQSLVLFKIFALNAEMQLLTEICLSTYHFRWNRLQTDFCAVQPLQIYRHLHQRQLDVTLKQVQLVLILPQELYTWQAVASGIPLHKQRAKGTPHHHSGPPLLWNTGHERWSGFCEDTNKSISAKPWDSVNKFWKCYFSR